MISAIPVALAAYRFPVRGRKMLVLSEKQVQAWRSKSWQRGRHDDRLSDDRYPAKRFAPVKRSRRES